MQMPDIMPARPRLSDRPLLAFAPEEDRVRLQGLFDWIPLPGIPDTLKCTACCQGKAGFGACLARCLATGQACDGGFENCSTC